ncbi:Superoxide dismutase [Aphelenchoides fujianensis]|nr:Superoxide dismutase [Aphelenchoides fujianensis]
MSTPTRIPLILWSQRTKTVTIKLEVSDCTLERLKIEGNHLVFKGKNEEAPYALDVDLHGRLTGCTLCSSSVELSKVTTHYAAHERCKQLGLDLFKLFWNVKLKAQLDAKQKERVDVPVGPKTEEGAKSEQPASSTAPASTTTTSAANAVAILEGDGTTGAVWFTQVGDLGNVKVESDGSCKFKFTDELITLNGDATVIGHSLIVHAKADESSHGTSGTKEESQKTGNADAPSAYGQIVYAALS